MTDMQTINIFERGQMAYHSDIDGAGPDVGISIGLGGAMIYAGEVPDMPGPWSLAIYTPQGRTDIGGPVEKDAAVEMVEAIAAALKAVL